MGRGPRKFVVEVVETLERREAPAFVAPPLLNFTLYARAAAVERHHPPRVELIIINDATSQAATPGGVFFQGVTRERTVVLGGTPLRFVLPRGTPLGIEVCPHDQPELRLVHTLMHVTSRVIVH